MGTVASTAEHTPDTVGPARTVPTREMRQQLLRAACYHGRARERFLTRTGRRVKKGAITAAVGVASVLLAPVAVTELAGGVVAAAGLAAVAVSEAAALAAAAAILGITGASLALGGLARIQLNQIWPLEDDDQLRKEVFILIGGFLTESNEPSEVWKVVTEAHKDAEVWAVEWAASSTADVGKFLLSTIVDGLRSPLPGSVAVTAVIGNDWGRAKNVAEAAGVALAEVLCSPLIGRRPVTLVGHSLGGRMIAHALKHLVKLSTTNTTIKDVVLMAPACRGEGAVWLPRLSVISGSIVHCYNPKDAFLASVLRRLIFASVRLFGFSRMFYMPLMAFVAGDCFA